MVKCLPSKCQDLSSNPSTTKKKEEEKEKRQISLKFTWKHKRPQIAKTILSEKSNVRGIKIPDFKLCYRDIMIKAWHCQINEHEDQWTAIENSDINPCSNNQLIFEKGTQIAQ
jgi:hypothetical protein